MNRRPAPSLPASFQIGHAPTQDEVAHITAAAHRARARAMGALLVLARRALRRQVGALGAWLRGRIDTQPPLSPWLGKGL